LLEIDFRPDEDTLRKFGFIAVGGFGVLALAAYTESFAFSIGLGTLRIPLASALAVLGVASGVLSLVHPAANRLTYVGLSVIAFPIGFVVSHVALGIVFFGMITPVALLFRALGRDELRLRSPDTSSSYWSEAGPRPDSERYFRQF